MLRIRLQRTGRRNVPTFRIVLAEHSAAVKGGHREILGHVPPSRDPITLECNLHRISYWVGKGARPTTTLARLLKRQGMNGMDPFIEPYTKKRKKKTVEEAPAAPSSAAQPPPTSS